ncbi:MAG: flagellar motor protein MotB [Gammaproteobacteria bacterium]|nr:flagellar motor protein MotB [Gammaproteobacteria bacterium]
MDDKKQPIIIKKIKKGGHGHHGGAWKVAYADFVTAMMAFFLLMWLLGGTSHLVREGIADWFKNPTGVQGPGGASTSMIKLGGAMEIPRSNQRKKSPSDEDKHSFKDNTKDNTQEQKQEKTEEKKSLISEQEKQQDKKRLDSLLEELKAAIEQSQALRPFKDQLLLDVTPEGLRIQIVDKENRPMFDSSSAILKSYTKAILDQIGKIINTVPNHVSIAGHTDATPFATRYIYVEYGSFEERRAYTNWELSADRANAARRELIVGGMHKDKIARVVGLADSVLFDKSNPYSPINRRISIIVLNKETEAAIGILSGKGGVKAQDIPQHLKNSTNSKS